MRFWDRFHLFHRNGDVETFYRDSTGGFSGDRGNAFVPTWFGGWRFIPGGAISPVMDAFLELFGLPLIFIGIFLIFLACVEAVGEKGILPAAALGISLLAAFVLGVILPRDALFAWIQPVIIYNVYFFTKYTLAEDGALGLLAWCIFAMVAVLLLAGTGIGMGQNWGVMYLLPYLFVWIWIITGKWTRIYYMIIYMVFMAAVITLIRVLKRLFGKKKKEDSADETSEIWQAGILILFLILGAIHPAIKDQMARYSLAEIKQGFDELGKDQWIYSFTKFLYGAHNFPPIKFFGNLADKMIPMLQRLE